MVTADGRHMDHGSREQADWSSPVYRQYVEKIDAKMAEHYGSNPVVWGWQLDNELSHYGQGISYAPPSQLKFRAWLREEIRHHRKLNADWGNSFWSQMYNQTSTRSACPTRATSSPRANPHAMLDVNRWFASETADYLRFQTAVLRRYVKSQWITTNFMMNFERVNPALSEKDLDIMSFTMYPVAAASSAANSASAWATRPYRFHTRLHAQPRQRRRRPHGTPARPGQLGVRQSLAAAGRRSFVDHAGLRARAPPRLRLPLPPALVRRRTLSQKHGRAGRRNPRARRQGIRPGHSGERRRCASSISPTQEPADYAARRTAFLNSFENRWDMDNHTQTNRWNTTDHWMKYYRALKSVMAPVDVITEDKDFSKYRI